MNFTPRSLLSRFEISRLINWSHWGSVPIILCLTMLALFSATASAGSINVTYYHNDATGSPVAATNAAGEVTWRKNYTSYGQASGKDGNNRRGYTGHVEEANGLVYAGARYYNPDWGRFLSVDPVGFRTGNPMSFNRYAYANNNPYKYVDPDGRVVETAWDIANVVMDVSSMAMNLADGNYGAAAVDATGLILDGAATALPGVPAGAGAIIKSKRAAERLENAASANQMQKKVERGQAPKEIDRFDKAHAQPGAKDHVHFKDGTSMNNDGSIHDANNGIPTVTNKIRDFLRKYGWAGDTSN